jgi:cyclopropane-fatty-acyl-phospholipid synthase
MRRAWIDICRRATLDFVGRMEVGRLELVEPDGRLHRLGRCDGLTARVELRDPRAWTMLTRRSRGIAEAYAAGWWESPDLTAVLRMAACNLTAMDSIRRRLTPIRVPLQRLRGARSAVTPARARRDIHRHYDLGDELFESMLDETMTYSAAFFPTMDASLREAQVVKLELACAKLGLGPEDHVLEIGSGWGSFGLHAASSRGCRVTTTTISSAQFARVRRRVREAGLEDRVTVLRRDYRELSGSYSALVSIEMIEAVGWRDFGTFLAVCDRLLRRDGAMLLQAITIDDRAYDLEKDAKTFIRTTIFPNGCLPSQRALAEELGSRTALRNVHHEDLTAHYVKTLQYWRRNVETNSERLSARGYDEYFQRLWRFYLSYCESGFIERRIAVGQTLLAAPDWRGAVPSSTPALLAANEAEA